MGSSDLIDTGRTVLRTEGEAILRMADGLDASFEAAVEAMFAAKGRVIVTGMGKSGHVGAKIAATLASTGTWFWSCPIPERRRSLRISLRMFEMPGSR